MKKLLLLAILTVACSNVAASDALRLDSGPAPISPTGGPFASNVRKEFTAESQPAPIGRKKGPKKGLKRGRKPIFNFSNFNEQSAAAKEQAEKEKEQAEKIKKQLDEIDIHVSYLKRKGVSLDVDDPALTVKDVAANTPGDSITIDGIQYNKLGYLQTIISDLYDKSREKKQDSIQYNKLGLFQSHDPSIYLQAKEKSKNKKVQWESEGEPYEFFDYPQIDDLAQEEFDNVYGNKKPNRFRVYAAEEEQLFKDMSEEGMTKNLMD